MTDQLVSIRCRFQKRNKHNQRVYTCNNLCVKVIPPARGETYCNLCKLAFDFDVSSQDQVTTSVNVQQIASQST